MRLTFLMVVCLFYFGLDAKISAGSVMDTIVQPTASSTDSVLIPMSALEDTLVSAKPATTTEPYFPADSVFDAVQESGIAFSDSLSDPDSQVVDTLQVPQTVLEAAISAGDTAFLDTLPRAATITNDTLPAFLPVSVDTLMVERLDSVFFTPSEASEFIVGLVGLDEFWRHPDDTLRLSLTRLLNQYKTPYDSVRKKLRSFDTESVRFMQDQITRYDTLAIMWLNDSTFIPHSPLLTGKPLVTQKTIMVTAADTSAFELRRQITGLDKILDSLLLIRDTLVTVSIDTLLLEQKSIKMHRLHEGIIDPPVSTPVRNRYARFSEDSLSIYIPETRKVIKADEDSPFGIVPSVFTPDSLTFAVSTLISYMEKRDSVLLYFSDSQGRSTPFWLTMNDDELYRFWVKNSANDSITIWIGNPTKKEITLFLEEDIQLERLERKTADDIPITTLRPLRSIVSLKPLEEIPVFWGFGMNSAFSMNQTYFSNWARGGQNSLSTVLDLRGTAQYNNRESKLVWNNNGRLRYGSIRTEEHGFRTNTDVLELNSQFNKVIRQKVDFSTSFYFKTQIARGYNYPNDSVVISKFLNPGTFTLGVGIEYKPFKDTRINFSPLSYRNTFVLDTAGINQGAHGIDADKRTRQEMGGQLVVNNAVNILDGLRVVNAVRLFSGYLDKPKNIDVDWEINLERQISWYFSVRLNLHLIYDDDIRFPVLGSDGEQLERPDGTPRVAPKAQFKQFLGLTLALTL